MARTISPPNDSSIDNHQHRLYSSVRPDHPLSESAGLPQRSYQADRGLKPSNRPARQLKLTSSFREPIGTKGREATLPFIARTSVI
jgi:hypothetical protein